MKPQKTRNLCLISRFRVSSLRNATDKLKRNLFYLSICCSCRSAAGDFLLRPALPAPRPPISLTWSSSANLLCLWAPDSVWFSARLFSAIWESFQQVFLRLPVPELPGEPDSRITCLSFVSDHGLLCPPARSRPYLFPTIVLRSIPGKPTCVRPDDENVLFSSVTLIKWFCSDWLCRTWILVTISDSI